MPLYNNLELSDMPWGFLYLLNYAIYQDNVKQVLSVYSNVPKPPKKIIYDPKKFDRWIKWSRNYKPRKTGKILPFGYGKMCDDENDYYESWG